MLDSLDNDHTKTIDTLIPQAELEATKMVADLGEDYETRKRVIGKNKSGEDAFTKYKHCFFTEFFHEAMNRLTKERGLRV